MTKPREQVRQQPAATKMSGRSEQNLTSIDGWQARDDEREDDAGQSDDEGPDDSPRGAGGGPRLPFRRLGHTHFADLAAGKCSTLRYLWGIGPADWPNVLLLATWCG